MFSLHPHDLPVLPCTGEWNHSVIQNNESCKLTHCTWVHIACQKIYSRCMDHSRYNTLFTTNSAPFSNPYQRLDWLITVAQYHTKVTCPQDYKVSISEMPTSGGLKSEDSLFCTTPPPQKSTPPCPQIDLATKLWHRNSLGHYMRSYMKYLLSWQNYSLSVIKYVQKCPRNHTMKEIWGKKGAKFQTKAQKSSKKSIPEDLVTPYGRDSWIIQDGWH